MGEEVEDILSAAEREALRAFGHELEPDGDETKLARRVLECPNTGNDGWYSASAVTLAAAYLSLRASLTRAQYTCEAHASEVLKGGECVWCTLTRVEEERDALKAKHGLFPEEHAYMALLRLPITGALRATPEIQSAMATCVDWLAAFVGHEPQQVQEFYEERVALEDDRLSRAERPE